MAGLIEQNRVLFFVVVWLTVTTVLALLSGWFRLMAAYPDQSIEPILRLRGQSGTMGGVSMRSVLTLSVCPTGLRVGMMRLFGLFCRISWCLGRASPSSETRPCFGRSPSFNSVSQ
jgi:nitrate/nitrite transporter NarK